MKYHNTFKPANIGSLPIKNRLVSTVTDSGVSATYNTGEPLRLKLYEEKAKGGFGLVVVGVGNAYSTSLYVAQKRVSVEDREYWDSLLPYLDDYVQKIRSHGAKPVLQIMDKNWGTIVFPEDQSGAGNAWLNGNIETCQLITSMTTEEINSLVELTVSMALFAKEKAFEAVEIHAAYDSIFASFLSPRTNKRTDAYGGNAEKRSRIVGEIVKGIKAKCGVDYPVIVKMNFCEYLDGGIVVDDAVIASKYMESVGADAIALCSGTHVSAEYMLRSTGTPSCIERENIKRIKDHCTIPIIFVGRNFDPAEIEETLALGFCDFVALGRQSIADPYFPVKMQEESEAEITPCIGCSQRCMSLPEEGYMLADDYGVLCSFNPFGNHSIAMQIKKAEAPKTVLVVGAGLAGMEAAWIAAKRGHNVTVYEKSPEDEIGGQYYIAAFAPYKQELNKLIQHKVTMCKKHNVRFVFDTEVTESMVRMESPDTLIIATGANPIVPDIKGINKYPPTIANDVLLGKAKVSGNVLVIGGGLVGLETAIFCQQYAQSVSVVEMRSEILNEVFISTKRDYLNKLHKNNINVMTETKVTEFISHGIIAQMDGKSVRLEGYDQVVLALGSKSYNPFASFENIETYVIGDANRARTAYTAIFEGARVGVKI